MKSNSEGASEGKAGEVRPTKNMVGTTAKPRRRLKVMKELREKLREPPTKTSQTSLDGLSALHCPNFGAESTRIVWKCCQAPFNQDGPESGSQQ